MSDRATLANGSDATPAALLISAQPAKTEMTETERERVVDEGNKFSKDSGEAWLLISGKLTSEDGEGQESTDIEIRESLRAAFGNPKEDKAENTKALNLIVDSYGGNLDSAYSTVLYLCSYTNHLRVHVPRKAKSASTLFAIGAHSLVMSEFAELGPLDTQLPDPRNAATYVSALDCYQSVDYVRTFGINTMIEVLKKLLEETDRRVPVGDLLDRASRFALGSIEPMMQKVSALDFGAWGRSLRIGENYAKKLLELRDGESDAERIDAIAHRLVYGYTHHLFPIDHHEARDIGLAVERMGDEQYDGMMQIVRACQDKDFAGFVSGPESKLVAKSRIDGWNQRRASEERYREYAQRARADAGGK
ncbi:hypothetical protein [Kitasatospora sp. NPDC085464]|uniref:SDH family Clp fold serine proteinase n=1 Tax=Kitasatospora sp. NPDC085464 TaxID=3364063 RepID=UPI0037C9B5A4